MRCLKVGDKQNQQIRLAVKGMTCASCERHVAAALLGVGAENVAASFRRNEATFELADLERLNAVKQAVIDAGYGPGDAEIVNAQAYAGGAGEPAGHAQPRVGGAGELAGHVLPLVASASQGGRHDFDLLIIGSGGSAFSAAIQAVSHGARVGIVERGTIGGTCVNIGCVPSKNMLRAAEINHLATSHPFRGLDTSAGAVDLERLVERKDELVGELRQHKYIDLIEEYGFELIQGEASFVDPAAVEVNGRRITAHNFLISTGASPVIPNIPGLHDVDYLDSTTALELRELPKRLAVIGSGYIALELGQMFHHLGADVTLMQRGARVLKSYEPEVSDAVTAGLRKQGMELLAGVTFNRVEQDGAHKRVHITVEGRQRVIEADALLVATGRTPNTKALNLGAAGVKVGDRGEVIVDDYLQTSNPRVYAAGDVTMGPQFVYVAAHEGAVVAENAVGGGRRRKVDLTAVPRVTFTNPAVAVVGLTEAEARSAGYEVISSVLPLDAVPRALVNRETVGVFKLVADARTRKLLGAHVVAENAGDVIYAAVLAVKFGLTVEDLHSTLAPYLTMAEGLKLAALTFDKDVAKLSCCAG